jgi:signal transduction histidine kinase
VSLAREGRTGTLSVENQGPPLPAQMRSRLFESMVSIRPAGREGGPHLGLGLYIVRLIAAFHGGEAMAHDRAGGDGVIVGVSIPLSASALAADTGVRSADAS